MRLYIILLCYISYSYTYAQIEPFVDHDWTIEKIITANNTTIMADASESGFFDKMLIGYNDISQNYYFTFSSCQGEFIFDDSNQEFNFLFYGCAVTPNHTNIAEHFVNVFIMQEGGLTSTSEGDVYGPFSYSFTYSGDLVYLDITNQAGSIATFSAANLSQEQFLKDSIAIYPNPVSELLNIKSSGVLIETVKIYDLSGRLINEVNINNNQIDVSQLQKGMYILNIETSVGVLREKIVKK